VVLLSALPFINTVDNNLKYALAALISTTGNAYWVGVDGLMTQASSDGKDGIVLFATAAGKPTTTTKDSGGTGAQNWVKWKGVRTAAGTEVLTSAGLGLAYSTYSQLINLSYLTQTISKTLALNDVYTLYWTFTVN
jgi:hypothetical protein